ncbi:hypothetical protein NIES4073_43270 [Kalymmatonema gypsitolerans NIES-4073]|nr:hypothetical protein NIES4073_43270 [Scytonema sp. NIES-4073]
MRDEAIALLGRSPIRALRSAQSPSKKQKDEDSLLQYEQSPTKQDKNMITQMMVQPSFWVESGVKISKVRNLYLFKFTDELQSRLEELSQKKKAGYLTSEEEAELTGILELDRIFTLLNARIIAES